MKGSYQTDCMDYQQLGLTSKDYCFGDCLTNNVMNQLNRVPYSSIIRELFRMKPVSYDDDENETCNAMFEDLRNVCKAMCNKKDCDYTLRVTTADVDSRSRFSVEADSPIRPSYIITYKETLLLHETIIYVLSCLGFWFGVSILSLQASLMTWIFKKFSEILV